MKPGYRTTEWWGTVLTHIITIMVLLNVPLDTNRLTALVPVASLILSAAAQVAYSHSRATVKAATITATAQK